MIIPEIKKKKYDRGSTRFVNKTYYNYVQYVHNYNMFYEYLNRILNYIVFNKCCIFKKYVVFKLGVPVLWANGIYLSERIKFAILVNWLVFLNITRLTSDIRKIE